MTQRLLKIIIPFFCLLLLCCGMTGHAQEMFISPPAQLLTKFKFRSLSGGVVLLQGQVGNKKDTLNFIFDTGSAGISLDSTTAAELGLKPTPSDRYIKGIAGVRKVDFVKGLSLHLPGLQVDSLDFHVNDYELLTSTYGETIDGIIGYSFLRRYIVFVDYDHQEINVYSPGGIKYKRGGFLFKPQFVSLPFFGLQVKDEREVQSKFFFDTGAGLCFLMSSDFEKDSTILKKNRKVVSTQAEGVGGKQSMLLSTIKTLKFGPYKFRNVPTYIFDDKYNITSYPHIGGLLGNDIMRRFNCYFNYPAREFYFIPNTHYRDEFDYSYVGLSLYQTKEGIVVMDVQKESPAEKAGLKDEDFLIGVANNLSGNIQTYKNLLENEGEKIDLLIRRGADLLIIKLKVGSIR